MEEGGVIYIGKGANNIDRQVFDVKRAQEFINRNEIMNDIPLIFCS